MRMSMSPQSGGFHRCTGAGPRLPRTATSASPFSACSGDFAGSAIFWRWFTGRSDIGMILVTPEGRAFNLVRPGAKRNLTRGASGRKGQTDERDRHRRAQSPDARRRRDARAGRRGARRDRQRHLRPGAGRRSDARHSAGGRSRTADRRPRPRQDEARRDARDRRRARRAAGAVHAGPDAVRHSRLRGDGGGGRRQAGVPLHPGADLRAAPDGRRDQPREPPHPVGAAAGDAGTSRDGRRPAARPAEPVPRARDAEPARAGRRLSAARGAARPLSPADRRRLSGPRGRAPHPDRDDRRPRGEGRGRS